MLRLYKYCVWLVAAAFSCLFLCAQDQPAPLLTDSATLLLPIKSTELKVGEIQVSGNKKTRLQIILREIPFKTGESYPLAVLVKKFEDARRQLMNTALFHTVVVAAKHFDGDLVTIVVEVKERWYLFPLPYFKPVDRNLNQWIVEQNAKLDRVNYGLRVQYNNATGRNDKFRFWFINGYTRQFSVGYDRLYIDKKMKWGLNTGFGIGKNREVNYNTIGDKQVFIKDNDRYIRSFVRANAELTYRRAIRTRHSLGVAYSVEEVSDTIVALNNSYFKPGHNRMKVPAVYYNMSFYDLDYNPYPTRGYAAQVSVSKSGFDKINNLFQLHVKGLGNWPVAPNAFFSLAVYGGIKLPFRQPYFNRRFLGYNDAFMQGYEYYVIDGVAGGYVKTTLTRKIIDFSVKVPSPKKTKEAFRIPFRVFGKIYGNSGYVYNPDPGENMLSNKILHGGGIGIDIVTFYDITVKIEWSFNQLGQNGIFIHRKTIF